MLKLQIEDTIKNSFLTLFPQPDRYSFKGSGLPYCPMREALSKCKESIGKLPTKRIPFKNRIYMDIGIAMHKTIQKAMGMQGILFGNWVCDYCKKTKIEMQWGPQYCCNRPMDYDEIRLKDKELGFAGAVDSIIRLHSDNSLCVLDFKSTEKKKINKSLPLNARHRMQVTGYEYLLKRPPFNLPIKHTAILYIAREDVEKMEVVPVPPDELAEAEFLRFCRLHKKAKEALHTGDILSLPLSCRHPNDEPDCPFSGLCFGPNKETNLKSVWEASTYNK